MNAARRVDIPQDATTGRAAQGHRLAWWLCILVMVGAGCAAPQEAVQDVVTVEGIVTARGHEPFVRYVLETSEGNLYALRIPEKDQAEFQTPAWLEVTGRLYVDDWDSHPFAHVDVSEWRRIN